MPKHSASFDLDALEPRLLLSASAITAVAHPGAEATSSIVSEAGPTASGSGADLLSYDPSAAINDIFGGLRDTAVSTPHAADAAASTAPVIINASVNGGLSQRSSVKSISISFNKDVSNTI